MSRMTMESPPTVVQNKRSKQPVNYVENFSDSDESNFSISLRTRSQSRGPSLRTRNSRRISSEEEDDNEVAGFSRMARRESRDSYQEDGDYSSVKTRSKSRAGAEVFLSPADEPVLPRVQTRSKTPSLGLLIEEQSQRLIGTRDDVNQLQEVSLLSE